MTTTITTTTTSTTRQQRRRRQKSLVGLLFLAGCLVSCSAFTVSRGPAAPRTTTTTTTTVSLGATREQEQEQQEEPGPLRRAVSASAAVAAAVAVSTGILAPVPPALAVQPTLNEAIVDVSETSYPILRALEPTAFRAFSTKIGEYLLRINPEKLGRSLELGIDALDSVDRDRLSAFNALLKETYADSSVESCPLVPLPPRDVVDKFAAVAADKVPSEKLAAFRETWNPSLEALKRTDAAICLPPSRKSLDELALAQADLGRSLGKTETRAFGKQVTPLIKQVITPGNALGLVADAKTLAPTATAQQKKDFAAAGKKAETASQLQIARDKLAEKNAKKVASAATAAAK